MGDTIKIRVYEDDDTGWTQFDDDLDITEQGIVLDVPVASWTAYKAAFAAADQAHADLCALLNVDPHEGGLRTPCKTPACATEVLPAHSFTARNREQIHVPERIIHAPCSNCGWALEAHGGATSGCDETEA